MLSTEKIECSGFGSDRMAVQGPLQLLQSQLKLRKSFFTSIFRVETKLIFVDVTVSCFNNESS